VDADLEAPYVMCAISILVDVPVDVDQGQQSALHVDSILADVDLILE
jgi:hypothetical protein